MITRFWVIIKRGVDKFGRVNKNGGLSGTRGPQGSSGIGFYLTVNGEYDIRFKQIKNLQQPTDYNDAATKKYVDHQTENIKQSINEKLDMFKDNIENMNQSLLEIEQLLESLDIKHNALDADLKLLEAMILENLTINLEAKKV